MLSGLILLIIGMALVLWGAARFTDGAVRAATRFGVSTFYVGVVISGFEPENLIIGGAAAAGHLSQIALGSVVGSAVFMLTAGLGVALLLVPMEVRIPRQGAVAMIASVLLFAITLGNDGTVSRLEGLLLVVAAMALLAWLYRSAPPVFTRAPDGDDVDPRVERPSTLRVLGVLLAGLAVMLAGAELVVYGVRALLASVRLSETFLGMAVVGMGESLEETARMVAPARRGHPELAWGNVVGTIVVLLTLNLGAIALIRPLTADPFVLRFHAPYLAVCALGVAAALLGAPRLGRGTGAVLVALYILYLAVNFSRMWQ